jgi:hypothetical protein
MKPMRLFQRYTEAALPQHACIIVAALALLATSPLAGPAAWAQSLNDMLGSAKGGGALGGLAGGGLPSLDQASTGNIAGVLQYCIKNNYLSGGSASSVLGKLTGSGEQTHDSGFAEGAKGMLQTDNKQSFALGGSGLKEQATHEVCDMVLKHAKSLL